ncbi:unnamed protein product [Pleuronectes platessa]|uniref:Uncharacterized protein n=1 Tax=Pleuronectes platessa TaxID=8262 RepID=A0A9N7V4C2_PLEPL|nr:unnamed protein product [Pleuronectes platessa]
MDTKKKSLLYICNQQQQQQRQHCGPVLEIHLPSEDSGEEEDSVCLSIYVMFSEDKVFSVFRGVALSVEWCQEEKTRCRGPERCPGMRLSNRHRRHASTTTTTRLFSMGQKASPHNVTDLRKPVAATPPQEIMCLCVWLRRFLVLPGTTLPVRTAKEPPLSLVILARCLAGNQPSGPLREEGGGDVSLLGMRPLYFSDIQQEQHSHHL